MTCTDSNLRFEESLKDRKRQTLDPFLGIDKGSLLASNHDRDRR